MPTKALLILTCLLLFAASVAAQKSPADPAINAYVRREVKSSGAAEYKEARRVLYGDLDGDGDQDAVLQYTLEGLGGGNSFGQMLAVFINRRGVYRFTTEEVVGGKFAFRTSKLTAIKDRKIILATESCSEPPQGLCDNPTKSEAIFVLTLGKLKET